MKDNPLIKLETLSPIQIQMEELPKNLPTFLIGDNNDDKDDDNTNTNANTNDSNGENNSTTTTQCNKNEQ